MFKKIIISLLFFITYNLSTITFSFAHETPLIIKMTSDGFEPREITTDTDTTLIFENMDSIDHWPASDTHPTHDIYPQFDPQKPIKPSESWQFKPDRGGTFKFHDHLNPHIKGILKITGEQSQLSLARTEPVDLNLEVKRITQAGFLRVKNISEDENSYLKSQMDYCFKTGGRDYCYKDLAVILTYQFSLPDILNLLQKNESYEGVFARCHELTHYLTRLAYTKVQNISTIYDQCTSVCHGGCYHGAIEQYLSDKKLSLTNSKIDQEIPKVCGQRSDYKVPLLYDECLHGIGHATMYINDGDLISALKLCDELPIDYERQTCYSGAFMENSSSSTNLDHPSKYIKAADPMYPCNILDKKYLYMCYRYQSSHFAIITQSNWKEVAKLCLKVPKDYQKVCFLTVGSNQVGFSQDFKTISDDCHLMPNSEAKEYCFSGVADALAIRYRNDFSKGVQFCSSIDREFQKNCFTQYGHSISSWSDNPKNRAKLCNSIENLKFAKWCKGEDTKSFNSPLIKFLSQLKEYFKQYMSRFNPTATKSVIKNLTVNEQMQALTQMSQKDGVEKVWQYLITSFKDQKGTGGNIHDLAHFTGGLIYSTKGFSGLGICSPSFAFGCFHGFLDKAFKEGFTDLPKAENGCKLVGKVGSGPYASCIHGIGHGIASFYQTADIKGALGSCERVSEGKNYCYDGVFMEFGRNAAQSFYKSDDPLYPCDSLDEKYAYECGRNQPPLLLGRFKMKFEDVVNVCLNASSTVFKEACFDSLGFSLASTGDVEKITSGCQKIGDGQFVLRCIKAAAGEMVFQEVPNWDEKSQAVCQASEEVDQCLEYVNRLVSEYRRVKN